MLPISQKLARMMLGELADAMITPSTLVVPNKLSSAGYRFVKSRPGRCISIIARTANYFTGMNSQCRI